MSEIQIFLLGFGIGAIVSPLVCIGIVVCLEARDDAKGDNLR